MREIACNTIARLLLEEGASDRSAEMRSAPFIMRVHTRDYAQWFGLHTILDVDPTRTPVPGDCIVVRDAFCGLELAEVLEEGTMRVLADPSRLYSFRRGRGDIAGVVTTPKGTNHMGHTPEMLADFPPAMRQMIAELDAEAGRVQTPEQRAEEAAAAEAEEAEHHRLRPLFCEAMAAYFRDGATAPPEVADRERLGLAEMFPGWDEDEVFEVFALVFEAVQYATNAQKGVTA